MKRKAAIILIAAAVFLLIISAFLYFSAPPLSLKKARAVAGRNGFLLKVSGWKSSGVCSIAFDSLSLFTNKGDSVLFINQGRIGYSVIRYLTGHLPVDRIFIDSVTVYHDFSRDTIANYGSSELKKSSTGFSSTLFYLEKKIISNLPEEVFVKHTFIILLKNNRRRQWVMDNFKTDNSEITGILKTEEGAEISFKADISHNHETYSLSAAMNGTDLIAASSDSNALRFSFNTLDAVLKKSKWSKQEIITDCRIKAEGLQTFHWRISPDTVKIKQFGTHQLVRINNHSAAVQPGSVLQINDIGIRTSFEIKRQEKTELALNAGIAAMPASSFFNSLPEGLFQSFKGIKAEGELSYALNFSVDFSAPDSLIFESTFNGKGIKILRFGEVNPYRLNEPFEHTVYEKGRAVRRIFLGKENPLFVPYGQIPSYLINSVITAEDGSFFGHAGFNEEAFRQSIITNIKEKRFARGGSTIPMQLVKNLYLGRNKNISRKMEEALWVWLIENKRMVSKERMLEIYLNIIEWGPDVYGIGEAARYYFNKKAEQLTLNESIFLAGIIPNPKYFRYAFDKDGNLRNYFQSFFRIVSERLLLKEKITEQEFSAVTPEIKLTGPAAALIMPADTLPDFTAEEPDTELPLIQKYR